MTALKLNTTIYISAIVGIDVCQIKKTLKQNFERDAILRASLFCL